MPVTLAFGLWTVVFSQARGDDVPQFHEVVNRHFDRWTHGEQGVLTERRVKELVLHPEIKGAEAAAIASIHSYQHKVGREAHVLTRNFLLTNHTENTNLRRDQAASGANLSHNFAEFFKHIKTAPRKAFAVDRPSLDSISQGHLGDCYFIAAVGAQTHRSPDPFLRLIQPNDDRSYEIRFPNGKQVIVPIMTDAQLALGSNAGNQGIWLNLLEIAAGIVEERERKAAGELPLDTLGGGGDSVFSIQLLTGHKALKHVIRPAVNGQHPPPAEQEVPVLATQISQVIDDGFKHRRLVCCGIGDWTVPPGLIKKHQYAIFGLNQGHIEIWNPWGHNYNFKPKGPPGMQHGYPTAAGRFFMPVHDFVRVFGAVNIESGQPLK
jgi:hypothetical protein